jgi:hypothetical protein
MHFVLVLVFLDLESKIRADKDGKHIIIQRSFVTRTWGADAPSQDQKLATRECHYGRDARATWLECRSYRESE